MERKVKSISVYALKPGMILAEDLFLNGIILVAKEIELNNSMIKKIFEFYPLDTIRIYDIVQEPAVSTLKTSKSQSLMQTESILSYFSNSVNNFLDKLGENSEPDLTEIKTMSKEILDNFNDYGPIIKSITNTRTIDEYLMRHCVNVALLSSMLGKWLNLSNKDLTLLTYAAFLHDIGKTKINPTILNKPSRLTKSEFEEIKKHPIYSYELIKSIQYLDSSVSLGVLMHHERLDGSGYPLGLKENKLNTFAKIIGITDMFDAMTSDKIYSKKQNPFKVLEIMQHDCMGLFDYNYLNTFIKQMANYYTGEMVSLNNGLVGKIIKMDINNISRPLMFIDSDFVDLNKEKNLCIIDLLP